MDTSRGTPPTPVQRGDPITAVVFNRLVRAVRKSFRIKGGPGIRVHQRGGSIVVGLDPEYRNAQLYRVTTVYVDGVAQSLGKGVRASGKQSEITYKLTPYRAVERAVIDNAIPNIGRLEENGNMEIQSAAVGDPVWVFSLVAGDAETRDVYIHVLSEQLADPTVCVAEEAEE